jgi:hypothetical protein
MNDQAGSSEAGAPARRRPSPAVLAVVGAVVGAGVAVAIVGLVWGFGGSSPSPSSGSGSGSSTTGTGASSNTFSAGARRLQGLLLAGTKLTYHVTYALTTTNPQAAGQTAVVEVWHEPPLERQDTSLTVSGAPAEHQEALSLTSGLVGCTQVGTGNWSCSPASSSAPTGPDAVISQIVQSLPKDQVTEHDSSIANMPAHCFDLNNSGTKIDVCVNSDGVPILVTNGTDTLRSTGYGRTIPKGTFVPPAPVKAGSSSTPSST